MRHFNDWPGLTSWHPRSQQRRGLSEKIRSRLEPHRGMRRSALSLEGLEGRVLLSGDPTIYTVNSIGNSSSGTGSSGTLPYVISQADANSNPAGSLIEFDRTVFFSPQTITLSNTLELSETAGPVLIDGPGAAMVTISGNHAVRVFQADSGVTATIDGLTISGGLNSASGGGIANSGTLSVTNSTFSGNSATGVAGLPPMKGSGGAI